MLDQPVFIGGGAEGPPPPTAPSFDGTPVLSLAVDSVACTDEFESEIAWATLNPDNLNFRVDIVGGASDIGMSGTLQFGAGEYGGGAEAHNFQYELRIIRRSNSGLIESQNTNLIARSNIGDPC